jgi:hypothetical protein
MYGRKPAGRTLMVACLVAGPTFATTFALADLYLKLPQPILLTVPEIAPLLAFCLTATVFGFVIALVPAGLGTLLMSRLGDHVPAARAPLAWTLAGAAIGYGLAVLTGAWPGLPAAAFALVATSALCARICWGAAEWE